MSHSGRGPGATSAPVVLDCLVEADGWPPPADLEALAHRVIEAAWAEAPPAKSGRGAEVSLVFTDDDRIRRLNAEWRGKDRPTNVLSFPATMPDVLEHHGSDETGPPFLLGDIVLARQTVSRECEAEGKTFEDHLSHLLVHGFLHLLGHDHETEAEAEAMEALERRILHGLAIADPYA